MFAPILKLRLVFPDRNCHASHHLQQFVVKINYIEALIKYLRANPRQSKLTANRF